MEQKLRCLTAKPTIIRITQLPRPTLLASIRLAMNQTQSSLKWQFIVEWWWCISLGQSITCVRMNEVQVHFKHIVMDSWKCYVFTINILEGSPPPPLLSVMCYNPTWVTHPAGTEHSDALYIIMWHTASHWFSYKSSAHSYIYLWFSYKLTFCIDMQSFLFVRHHSNSINSTVLSTQFRVQYS